MRAFNLPAEEAFLSRRFPHFHARPLSLGFVRRQFLHDQKPVPWAQKSDLGESPPVPELSEQAATLTFPEGDGLILVVPARAEQQLAVRRQRERVAARQQPVGKDVMDGTFIPAPAAAAAQ